MKTTFLNSSCIGSPTRQSVPSWSVARTPKSSLEVLGSLMPTKWSGPPLSFMSVMSHPKNNFFSSTVPHCTALDSFMCKEKSPIHGTPHARLTRLSQRVSRPRRPPVSAHHTWPGASGRWQSPQLSQIKTFLRPHGICPSLQNFPHTFVLQLDSLQKQRGNQIWKALPLGLQRPELVSQRSGRSGDNRLLRKLTESTCPNTTQVKLLFTTWGHISGDLNTLENLLKLQLPSHLLW